MPETTRHLLLDQQPAWKRILDHPFVIRTSAGSLPSATFDRWLAEDHFFVLSFRAFLEALTRIAPDQQAREVLAGGLAALGPELELFESAAAERGLDLTAEPSLLNVGYSSYLLASVQEGWPVGITVLYGVEKAYYDAWASVRDSTDPDTQYAGFIANWSSPEFSAYVDQLAALVDREELTAPMSLAFDRVVRFELAFWDLVQG
ncbi:MAG TPA: transcriptional regulator [Kribbella sp.]|uniref:transcriptional regulator n=1 Tax=Kribbella sp. TaxID=1871183 RepID=UPI002D77BBF8|nr:transcriptional regulator [Kribbella sp.]HET6298258.1 transcriptional regulator [Kribbella sp.]